MRGREILYNLLILSAFLLGLPWIVYQVIFVKRQRQGIAQRFGFAPEMDGPVVWCHAVSVGEVRAVQPMLSLLQEGHRTADRIVLSTVTPTGREAALRECGFVKEIFFFPLDLPFCVGRAIDRVKPELFTTVETEIWPNFLFACFRRKIPVVIVNGRISDTSFSRYLKFRWFFRPLLERVTLFLMQSEEDARRIRKLGAKSQTVLVTGNMKYDRLPEKVSLPVSVRQWAEKGFLLVAGSTHSGEEEIVLDAVSRLESGNVLVALVPRHPERFEEVTRLLKRRNDPFTKYSEILQGADIKGRIMLVDAMGVLDGFYSLADLAFVGGSLVPIGGHNLLEPAMHGVPIISGPYTQNFRDISEALIASGGCLTVSDHINFSELLQSRFLDGRERRKMGRSAFHVWEEQKGGAERNAVEIGRFIGRSMARSAGNGLAENP